MLPYIFMSFLPGIAALGESSKYSTPRQSTLGLKLFFIVLTVFVGFRYEVGPDWGPYLGLYEWVSTQKFSDSLGKSEPAYVLINFISGRIGGGVVLVNLICAIFANAALYLFCRSQARPWLAAFILTTSFVFVQVMGVTRQGVAVSIFFLAVDRLAKGRSYQYVGLVILAATFHVSALAVLPLLFAVGRYGFFLKFLFFTTSALVIGYYIAVDMSAELQRIYIDRELGSSGIYSRFVFHIFAAFAFFLLRERMMLTEAERNIYKYLSLAAVFLFALAFVSPSTTVVDRIAFYLIPLQVAVLSQLPNLLSASNRFYASGLIFVLFLYSASFAVYFSLGTHAEDFLPYRMGWFG